MKQNYLNINKNYNHKSGTWFIKNNNLFANKNLKRESGAGFTIVELLVVIAIIAVLASIVLVNVTQYINRGRDAAIRGNMSTILVNSVIYFEANSSYTHFNGNVGYTRPAAAITAITLNNVAPVLLITATTGAAYCVRVTLRDTTMYCIDNTGFKGVPTAATGCDTIITCR